MLVRLVVYFSIYFILKVNYEATLKYDLSTSSALSHNLVAILNVVCMDFSEICPLYIISSYMSQSPAFICAT